MDFTLRSYLANPYGKGNSTMPNMQMLRSTYLQKMENIKSRILIKWFLYKKEAIIALVAFPSESIDNIFYDVVFEFDISGKDVKFDTNVLDLPVKVFSNSPSFSYTYANTFQSNDLLCKWLKTKYTKNVRKNSAVTRNSGNIIGFEKTLYLSGLYISTLPLIKVQHLSDISEKATSLQAISKKVLSQEEVETKYRNIKHELAVQKRENEKIRSNHSNAQIERNPANKINEISHVQSVRKSSGNTRVVQRVQKKKTVKKI